MGQARFHPSRCKVCGKHKDEVGSISARGRCAGCGQERMNENYDALKSKRGPFAHWWAFKLAESVGWAPLDGAPPPP